jgi:WD40 repeat protein
MPFRWSIPCPQFALLTLLLVTILFSGCMGLWFRREPWMCGLVLHGPLNLTVFRATYSPDGRRIVTAGADTTARIWDAETSKELTVLAGHSAPVYSAAYSPDGRRIVTAGADTTARIWDAEISKELTVLAGHSAPVYSAAYSPDGRRIVTASVDDTSRIWDAETGKELTVLEGHTKGFRAISYSPDGRRIVTAGDQRTVFVWDAETNKELAVLTGHTDDVRSSLYSPDSQRIVTASADGTVRVWSRRRPEYWWGISWLPEFWVALFSGGTLLFFFIRNLCSKANMAFRTSTVVKNKDETSKGDLLIITAPWRGLRRRVGGS